MSLSGTESQTSLNSRLDGISVGGDTVLASAFSVDCRMGSAKERVIIGDACALECTITLEREVGTVSIGDHTFIGRSHLVCAHRVEIGSNILIAWGCTIMDHDSHSLDWEQRAGDIDRWREGLASGQSAAAAAKEWSSVACAPVRIGDKAWLGFRTIVLKGVTIGEGAVVGAGSVVARDVPPWTVVAGNPARVIKRVPSSDR